MNGLTITIARNGDEDDDEDSNASISTSKELTRGLSITRKRSTSTSTTTTSTTSTSTQQHTALPSFGVSFPPTLADRILQEAVLRQANCVGEGMTTASAGYVPSMPAATTGGGGRGGGGGGGSGGETNTSPTPSSTSSDGGGGGGGGGSVSAPPSSASPPPAPSPLLTIVPALHGSPPRAGSVSPSCPTDPLGVTTAHLTAQVQSLIISTVSEGDGSLDSTTGGVSIHGSYVQYVETQADPLYTATNPQMAYPVYTVGDTTLYSSSSSNYYQPGSTTPVSYSQEVANSPVGGQILSSGTSTYVIQQGIDSADSQPLINTRASPQTSFREEPTTPRSRHEEEDGVTYIVSENSPPLDADAQANLAHATRVSPATVQWLMDNYETAEGVSLPRSTLYNHYLRHCADHKLDPVNAASFGKLMHGVFLGTASSDSTRGNSKYHYYGIRIKPSSPLINVNDDGTPMTLRTQSSCGGSLKKTGVSSLPQQPSQTAQTPQQSPGGGQGKNGTGLGAGGKGGGGGGGGGGQEMHYDSHTQVPAETSPMVLQNQQYLGDVSQAVPPYDKVDFASDPLPTGVTRAHLDTFTSLYREHCETIVEAIYNFQFSSVETLWKRFWLVNNNNMKPGNCDPLSDDEEGDLASLLPSSVLQALLRSPPVLEYIRNFDYQFYQNLVEVLIPDVLRSIPSTLTQAIRNFAKSLESWLYSAMLGCPQELVSIKVIAVASLAQTLRRYTSLNHLAQAARAVLQNSAQISQMLADLNRVDFHNVQEQASWVCQCDVALVDRLEEDFKATLQQQNSLEQWAEWLQAVVGQVLRPHEGKADFPKQARQFLLKWSFYSSMVIRDLTLRSAASFGSFHLIRLLYDEYMFYLVEHRVASSLGLTPIAVISQGLGSTNKATSTSDSTSTSSTPTTTSTNNNNNNSASGSFMVFNGQTTTHHRAEDDAGMLPAFKRMKYES
ncbi:DNA-binding protein RFX2-like [Eriocheir sinensis]|uniref:DNA-binding protein RFX2-like n=1 Tax=Eriocheir sinensis TaxID=95602 RepID=UPI0021C5CB59|nr:DNA-binding protein RFX2-like [Eriocheir sinensis]